MKDSFENDIAVGFVVETFDAYSDCDNATWVVTDVLEDSGELRLDRLNKDMRKSKSRPIRYWPFCSYCNDTSKRLMADEHNEKNAKIKVIGPWVEPEKKPVSDKIRFLKTGIRKGEQYCACHYWLNKNKTITIYARHYNQHIPREVGCVHNETDHMTDYFETDRVVLTPDSRYYNDALRCCRTHVED